jgi:hypothetical protein
MMSEGIGAMRKFELMSEHFLLKTIGSTFSKDGRQGNPPVLLGPFLLDPTFDSVMFCIYYPHPFIWS